MNVRISLHGALRDADASGYVELEAPDGCTVGALREHLVAFLKSHAPQVSEGIARRAAFATNDTILHDRDAVPANTELAILPPVSGG